MSMSRDLDEAAMVQALVAIHAIERQEHRKMREALLRIARTTSEYDEFSQMGAIHEIASKALERGK